LQVRAALALIGDDLELRRDVCVTADEQGVVESIESWGSCGEGSLGGSWAALLPQPANAHVHSADGNFPEFGVDLGLHDLVAPPEGLKYRLLSSLSSTRTAAAIRRTYRAAYALGVGLLVDFREGGGTGCLAAQLAKASLQGDIEVIVLGTPGPTYPMWCQGLGLSSPLDYPPGLLSALTSQTPLSFTHVAEDPRNRDEGDLEVALRSGFRAFVHGTYLSTDDLSAVRDHGVPLILCPRSNMWHGLRPPPVADAVRLGLTLGLGSDNAAWNLPDPWAETEVALLVARSQGARGEDLAKEILRALMVGGYLAAGAQPRIIAEGRKLHGVLVNAELTGILSALGVYTAIAKRAGRGLALRVDGNRLEAAGLA